MPRGSACTAIVRPLPHRDNPKHDIGVPSEPALQRVHLGPFFVHAYGLLYAVAVVLAVAIVVGRWEARGGARELVHEVALWGFPAGLVGGRLYFLATSWSEVPDHWWGPFAIWRGGLGIYGGIVGGTLGGLWVLRRRGADVPAFLDAAAPALLVAQAIGGIGNWFNQELFGGPSTLPWALHIDPRIGPPAIAGLVWFARTQWTGRRWTRRARGGSALLAAGGLICLAGCGHGAGSGDARRQSPTASRPQGLEVAATSAPSSGTRRARGPVVF